VSDNGLDTHDGPVTLPAHRCRTAADRIRSRG